MISCDKYRASIQITLNDIFSDFNDSRREPLMKRVRVALEDLEIRMRNEVEGNNLANLQMLLKKQQTLKKMEDQLQLITLEVEEKRERDRYLNGKITELQAELARNAESHRHMLEKVRHLQEIIASREAQLALRDQAAALMDQKMQEAQREAERAEMERHKVEELLKRLRESYQHKTEEAELMLKIKDRRMEESINESITHLQVRHQRERERREIETKLKSPKVERQNQRVQVNLQAQAQAPTPPPTTNRSRESQLTHRHPHRSQADKEVQTAPTQEKKIVEFIDKTPQKQAEKLEEIRLVYSATPKFFPPLEPPPEDPKITKYYAPETYSMCTQTDPVVFKPPSPTRLEEGSQAYAEEDRSFMQNLRQQISNLREKYLKMEEMHERRYWELVRVYEERPSQAQDLKENELLRVALQEAQLQLAKKEREAADHRDFFLRAQRELTDNQNQMLLKRLSVKLGEKPKKPRLNQTCSFFHVSPKRAQTQDNQEEFEEGIQATHYTTQVKRAHEEEIITVTKSKNALKYRRLSLKTSLADQDSRPKLARDYQKYSKLKTANLQ